MMVRSSAEMSVVSSTFMLAFAEQYAAYVVQFCESLDRGEIVDVGADDFVAHLRQHRIVELEK